MAVPRVIPTQGHVQPCLFPEQVPRLFWNLQQAAARLGFSTRTFYELRESHPLYSPDGSRTIVENPKKTNPLWSEELLQLIAYARTLTAQGVRQLSDDEAYRIRIRMGEEKRQRYLGFIDE